MSAAGSEYGVVLAHGGACSTCTEAAGVALRNIDQLAVRESRVSLDGSHHATVTISK